MSLEPAVKADRLEAFDRLCRERGVASTLPRRVILEAVLDCDDHPTADEVLAVVAERHGGISRTTVYRALETLARLGVITKTCHPGSSVRYDPRTEPHHHLVCMRCNTVVDVFDEALDALPVPDVSGHGFEIADLRVQLRGVCRPCQQAEESR